MRKISFFWKTWFTTMVILVLSIIVCFGSFILVTQYVNGVQQAKRLAEIEGTLEEVGLHIEENGIDDEYYLRFISMGYTIELRKADTIIFPIIKADESLQTSITVNEASTDIETEGQVVSYFSVGGFEEEIEGHANAIMLPSLSKTKTISFNGEEVELTVFDITMSYQDQAKLTELQAIIPYYIVGGLLVAMIGSYFYAMYFTKKMKHLNSLVERMGASEEIEIQQPKEGDELQQLENNLYLMYQKLQDTMIELDEEVVYTKKLEEDKQLFMRGATHELKTPIMAASVMLEGMMEKVGEYEDTDVYLRKCYQTLQSMSVLVNEILEVSKIEHVQFTGKTEVTPIIEATLEMYQPEIQDKELHIRTFLKSKKDIKMSEKSFRKVISNLIGNAVKYSDSQGEIAIHVTENKVIVQNQISENTEIRVETLFEPFKSGVHDEEIAGHGLGLYIVSSLLDRYNIEYNCYIEEKQQTFVFEIMV